MELDDLKTAWIVDDLGGNSLRRVARDLEEIEAFGIG